jgi:hypothetical protein
MFKQRNDYLMEMGVEVNYAPVEAVAAELSMTIEQARQEGLGSLVRHVQSAAKDALRETHQKWKGATTDEDGEWPEFSVRFQGDSEGAIAAYERWATTVESLNGTSRILRASLRGSDGINLQYMDEALEQEYAALADSLTPEALAKIDELMDPDR